MRRAGFLSISALSFFFSRVVYAFLLNGPETIWPSENFILKYDYWSVDYTHLMWLWTVACRRIRWLYALGTMTIRSIHDESEPGVKFPFFRCSSPERGTCCLVGLRHWETHRTCKHADSGARTRAIELLELILHSHGYVQHHLNLDKQPEPEWVIFKIKRLIIYAHCYPRCPLEGKCKLQRNSFN